MSPSMISGRKWSSQMWGAVLRLEALVADAGAHHLAEPVDVERVDAEALLELVPHLVRPRFGAEHGDLERGGARVDALPHHRVGDREQVARRAEDRVGLEVADELHLARGLAARHRDDGRAERLDPGVRPESAGEQPVAVGVVHLHARADAAGPQRSRDERCPALEVALRVTDDGGPPRGAARGVDAGDLLHRHGEHAERVRLAQVGLGGERKPRDIRERADVAGVHAGLVELARVERHVRVGVPHGLLQPLELERLDLGAGHPLLGVEVGCGHGLETGDGGGDGRRRHGRLRT